ncbi:hypothetical protein B566_EDAN013652 [Ephemera danica]|nr:hypothetical protein B566_EDAN013652 [Ephemera danica]
MADDIDDFLQQVESQLFHSRSMTTHADIKRNSFRAADQKADPEVTQLLAELDHETSKSLKERRGVPKLPLLQTSVESPVTTREQKCFPLLLGAADSPTGLSTIPNPKTCDSLRCTSCERSIVAMPHSSWQTDVDSQFLRQAAVQPSYLSTKLDLQEGARAYACQCKCLTVAQGTQSVPETFPWMCGKHAW